MYRWKAYITVFLVAWVVLLTRFGYTRTVAEHWPIAVVMVLGSLVAGSTPMGGGTVAFPILALGFGQPVASARNFALIVQALGMTSASLFMIGRGTKLPVWLLMGSTAGAAIGFAVGMFCIEPFIDGNLVKLLFSCIWMSFGLLTLAKNREICGLHGKGPGDSPRAAPIGLAAGLIGGSIAGIIGVGVEMAIYTAMVLVYRADLKIAIPTAVAAAALASLEGAALHVFYLRDIEPATFYDWLAAGPIVIFGAPAGAFLMTMVPRIRVLYAVSALCLLQFVWTLNRTAHRAADWWFVLFALLAAGTIQTALYSAGKRAGSMSATAASFAPQ